MLMNNRIRVHAATRGLGLSRKTVQLIRGCAETALLCGTYAMHFILNDGSGEARKLLGTLNVLDTPKEVL